MPNLNTCEFDGCENPIRTKTYCNGHRLQYQRGQELRPLRRRGRPADPCTFEGCVRGQEGHSGFCSPHNKQLRRSGQMKRVRSEDTSPTARFWWYVTKGADGDCWNWNGLISDQGYGTITVGGRPQRAHRYSWEIHNGPIPEGMQVDHICHNTLCTRPDHLRLVTQKQNNEHLKATRKNSTTGVRGVSFSKKRNKWVGHVTHNYRYFHVGMFDSLEEAEAAVIAKRKELFTHNNIDRAA